ncbi:MAG: glycoside hydrolase family 31 protein, partial [bacterium]|nr:glycoside hydrolase family 31 protein [bacterium]
NSATWAHMEESIPMSLNVGLSGQPFIGPDIGGFAGNGDGKLIARWMGFGSLLPFSRGHTGKGNIDKEPWAFGPEVEATCKAALQLRYRLMPHLYTVFHEATVTGLPVARPLFFADPTDPALRSEDDSFLIGDGLLVQAQMLPDGTRVPVMPKGDWKALEPITNPDLPHLFVKPGSIIPMGPAIEFVDEKPLDDLTLIVNLDANGTATGTLYEDAGDGYGYQTGEFRLSTFTAVRNGDKVSVSVATEGAMPSAAARTLKVVVLK